MDAGTLFGELRRRRVFRALVGYGMAAFAVLQVIEPVMHGLHWPDEVLSWIVVILAAGFPLVVSLAWIFDVNAGRIERAAPAPGLTRGRLALVLLALGALAAAPGTVWYLYLRARAPAAKAPAAAQRTPSIAVLPFADMSPGKDQEYFSDGIAEEILDALARVKGLRVAGRTSAFQFKGKNQDLRKIAETLGVATVLEGSVRKQGNRLRITAQLIQAADGFRLWSHTFDGDLTDVFALQESIARAITSELKVVLQSGQNAPLVPVATKDPEAYALYLQATAVMNKRELDRMGDAIGWLDQAVKLDPKFARGHARLAMAHALRASQFTGLTLTEARRHARLAAELDPLLAEPWVVLGLSLERRFLESSEAFSHALELDPDDPLVNLHAGQWLIMTGYTRNGNALLDRALAADPVLPNALFWRGIQHVWAGELDAAEKSFARASAVGLFWANSGLSELALARGDRKRARELIAPFGWRLGQCLKEPTAPLLLDADYLGDAASVYRARPVVRDCLASGERISQWVVRYLYHFDPGQALDVIARGVTANEANVLLLLWGPFGEAARRDPGFAAFARKIGLAELWDRYGPPDRCRRINDRDYVCS